ncbi:hypothetical protein [Anatilimnocola floriformis]|uniref:hypothetical protein n=1 Tax=Anatilimnocola floriformis TaxID=2948575 RepID=UPI0020C2B543|nr:hypothetical protein [Anatilimnocola floriformis]
MKLDKLIKRLKKDAAASPQKAGALGLMLLVALYFWAPLVMKSIKGKGKPGSGPAAKVIRGDDPVLVKAAAHPATNTAHWDRIRDTLAQDRLMQAAVHNADWRNPFQPLAHAAATDTKIKPIEAKPETQLSAKPPAVENELAEQLLSGVTLSSVLIGKKGPSAVIRGKLFRVGDVLLFGGDNGAPKVEFRITAIDEQGVDLKFEGQPFRIERTKPTLASGELQPTNE